MTLPATLLLAAALVAPAQNLTAPQRPTFDVASVKPCKDGSEPGNLEFLPGRLNLGCLPLIRLISMAYGENVDGRWNWFPMKTIEGGPSWIQWTMPGSNEYAIDARAAGASVEMVKGPMFRALLEDRFQLKLRRETRQVRVYALTVAKGSPKLKPFDGSCARWDISPQEPATAQLPSCTVSNTGRGYTRVLDMRGITVSTFAARVGQRAQELGDLDGPIIDKTELSGSFDVRLEYAFDPIGGATTQTEPPANVPSLFNALQEQLGLRLERSIGPRDFLVIEHVERPSEN